MTSWSLADIIDWNGTAQMIVHSVFCNKNKGLILIFHKKEYNFNQDLQFLRWDYYKDNFGGLISFSNSEINKFFGAFNYLSKLISEIRRDAVWFWSLKYDLSTYQYKVYKNVFFWLTSTVILLIMVRRYISWLNFDSVNKCF